MTPRLTYRIKVHPDGRIEMPSRGRFAQEIAKAFAGKSPIMEVYMPKKGRTLPQLRYYWGVYIEMIYQALKQLNGSNEGFDRQTVHEYLKEMFLATAAEGQRREIVLPDGEIKELAYSTRFLTRLQFMAYLDLIKKWAAEVLWLEIIDPYEPFDDVDQIDIDQTF